MKGRHSSVIRQATLCVALSLTMGGAWARANGQAALPPEVRATAERLRGVPDARLRVELLEALQAHPRYRVALLQAVAEDARPARVQVVEQVRGESREVASEASASDAAVADGARTSPGQEASAVEPEPERKAGKSVPTALLAGGGVALGALALAGGGGGSDGGATASPPAVPPPPPPPPTNPPSFFETPEFRRNYSLSLVRAQYAYSTGVSGQGVLVAVVDSGLNIAHPEFSGRIAPAGLVIRDNGPAMTDPDGHGTHVAGIIAASRNDTVMHGVAYNATLLPIKYIKSEEQPESETVTFSQMINRQLQYRPRISNNSWGERTVIGDDKKIYHATRLQDVNPGDYRGAASAYRQLLDAGIAVVFSAGNNVTGDPSKGLQPSLWAALPQAYPELQGLWLAAVSVGADGIIATTSHRCGDARAWCLAAPGTQIVSTWTGELYASASGTSLAAPHVSGGLALLMERFPTLATRQVVERLLISATKAGIYADQSVYGQGLMNLEAATQPIGTVSAMSESGEVLPVTAGVWLGNPIGDALGAALSRVEVVLKDSLDAPFVFGADAVLLGQRTARAPEQAVWLARLQQDQYQGARELHNGFRVSYRAAFDPTGRRDIGELHARRDGQDGGSLTLGFGDDTSWSQGLLRVAPELRDVGVTRAFANPFLAVHQRAMNLGWHAAPTRLGVFGLQAAYGEGGGTDEPGLHMPGGSSSSVQGEWRWQPTASGWSAGVQLGMMQEHDRVLGGYADLWRDARLSTRYLGLDLLAPLGQRLELIGRYHIGRSSAGDLGWAGAADLHTAGYAYGLVSAPSPQWQWGAMAHAPLAVTGGRAEFALPTILRADNSVAWEKVQVPLQSDLRPREYELFVGWRNPAGNVRLKASLLRQFDPAHGLGGDDTVLMFNASIR